jgi:carboxypeptidase family protein
MSRGKVNRTLKELCASASLVLVTISCGGQGATTAPTGVQSRIDGAVFDGANRPLAGATVMITDGPLSGTAMTTDAEGEFLLSGHATGSVTLKFVKAGFKTRTVSAVWRPVDSRSFTTYALETDGPQLVIEPGDYTMTLATDLATATGLSTTSCTGFPSDLARRSYPVTIETSKNTDGLTHIVYGVCGLPAQSGQAAF